MFFCQFVLRQPMELPDVTDQQNADLQDEVPEDDSQDGGPEDDSHDGGPDQTWNRTGRPVPDRPVRSGPTFQTGRSAPVFTGLF
jgi:hypothetical protein